MTGLRAIIAAAVAWAVLVALLGKVSRLPLDQPNARSLHVRAVPRGGGLAIWAGWLAGVLWLPGPKLWLVPLAALIVISLLDDRRAIHPGLRLLVHFGAAGAWIWLNPQPLEPVLAVLLIVWMTNLYNFMDGSDGLAGMMTVVGFGAYSAAAWPSASPILVLALPLAAATLPFLAYNAPPARVFLGDAGSVPLGFLAAALGFAGWQEQSWPAWFPPLVFLPFIADASLTLALRLMRGARVWEPHREHFYQRLVQSGWGHGRTLALYTALMVGTAGTAVAALAWARDAGVIALATWAVILALVFATIEYHYRRRGVGFEESKG